MFQQLQRQPSPQAAAVTVRCNCELRYPAHVLTVQFHLPLWRCAGHRCDRNDAAAIEETKVFAAILCSLIQLTRIGRRPLPDAAGEQPVGCRIQNGDRSIHVAVAELAERYDLSFFESFPTISDSRKLTTLTTRPPRNAARNPLT